MFRRRTHAATTVDSVLPGRSEGPAISGVHFVNGSRIVPPFGEGIEVVHFAMGCFWGAERVFWELPGVSTTAVGYAGGFTENASYEDVCTGRTGHAETVLVAFDPRQVSFDALLKSFWEEHDPTQRDRQGNDVGTQYRSGIYTTTDTQFATATLSREEYQKRLSEAGFGEIATEIKAAEPFYYAEEYHQQYLAKNPGGYCGLAGTGVACQTGLL